MWSKKTSGLIGMFVGGIWFLAGLRNFSEQGLVAIGMPLIIFTLGFIYFRKGSNESAEGLPQSRRLTNRSSRARFAASFMR